MTEAEEIKELVKELDRYMPKSLDCNSAFAIKSSSGLLVKLDEVLYMIEQVEARRAEG